MVGDWEGESEGQPGKGSVKRTYRFVLDDKFLHEHNVSTYPPQEKNEKGEVHEHWSFFSLDRARQALVLRQFHQEGFVIQYARVAGESPPAPSFSRARPSRTPLPGGRPGRPTSSFLPRSSSRPSSSRGAREPTRSTAVRGSGASADPQVLIGGPEPGPSFPGDVGHEEARYRAAAFEVLAADLREIVRGDLAYQTLSG